MVLWVAASAQCVGVQDRQQFENRRRAPVRPSAERSRLPGSACPSGAWWQFPTRWRHSRGSCGQGRGWPRGRWVTGVGRRSTTTEGHGCPAAVSPWFPAGQFFVGQGGEEGRIHLAVDPAGAALGGVGRQRHQTCVGLAGFGQDDFFTRVRLFKQAREVGLGVADVDCLGHGWAWTQLWAKSNTVQIRSTGVG